MQDSTADCHGPMSAHTFSVSSDLRVSIEEFLRTLTLDGVNAELHPLAKMTAPNDWASRSIMEMPEKQHLFQSWILFLGILPIDRHSILIESVKPNEGFTEMSSSTLNSVWRHERRVTPNQSGCRVTDTVEYQSRLPLVGHIFKPMYRSVFLCRHRNLRARYGERASAPITGDGE